MVLIDLSIVLDGDPEHCCSPSTCILVDPISLMHFSVTFAFEFIVTAEYSVAVGSLVSPAGVTRSFASRLVAEDTTTFLGFLGAKRKR